MVEKEDLKYWAVVPSAGRGTRMNSSKPKQYLKIAGKTIIEHAMSPLLRNTKIHKIVVVLAEDDKYWRTLPISENKKIILTTGGDQRCHSVFNGLEALQTYAYDQDWVLVHDAARPLLARQDLNHLITELENHDVGGLLGVPIHSTVKRVNEHNEVLETVPRRLLWRAFTPQMFRFGILNRALKKALPAHPTSDSAKAVEQLGYAPKMVEGRADNIKVTRPTDLVWVEQLLQVQGE